MVMLALKKPCQQMVVVVVRVMAMNSTMMNASEAKRNGQNDCVVSLQAVGWRTFSMVVFGLEVKEDKGPKTVCREILQDVLETKNEGHDFFGVELITKQEYDWAVERHKKESGITTRCFLGECIWKNNLL